MLKFQIEAEILVKSNMTTKLLLPQIFRPSDIPRLVFTFKLLPSPRRAKKCPKLFNVQS